MRSLIVGLALTLAGASATHAQPADDRLEAAVALYSAGDFANAAVIFESLYNDTKLADALFGWAQSLRQDGRCPEALTLYRKYLAETNPQPQQVDATNEAMALCPKQATVEPDEQPDDQPGDQPGEPSEETPVATTVIDPVDPSKVAVDRQRQSRDWMSVGLIGFSAVAAATSVTFYVLARGSESDAEGAGTHEDFAVLADRAESRQRISQIAGAAAVAGAAGLLVWKLTRGKRAEPSVTAGLLLATPGAFVRARF